eukprot:COSAG03_NODE_2376_length_2827_cov_5.585044_3_plen_77_part_00
MPVAVAAAQLCARRSRRRASVAGCFLLVMGRATVRRAVAEEYIGTYSPAVLFILVVTWQIRLDWSRNCTFQSGEKW